MFHNVLSYWTLKFPQKIISCLSFLSHPFYSCWVLLKKTAREAEAAEMVEGMAGSKSQQTQINDGITLSAQGTKQPDLPEGLTTWQNTCQTSLAGLLIQNRFCLWALRVCYYKHMLQSPCVTNSSASPWMAPTQNIKHTACNPSQCGQKFSALVNFNFFFFFF